jgi:hypothetical protein
MERGETREVRLERRATDERGATGYRGKLRGTRDSE